MADVGDEVGEGIKRGMNRVLSEILREWLRKHMGKRPEPGQEHCTAPLDDPELTRAVTEALGAANIPYEVKRQSLTVGSDGQLHERATLLFDANDFDRVREVLDATLEEVKADERAQGRDLGKATISLQNDEQTQAVTAALEAEGIPYKVERTTLATDKKEGVVARATVIFTHPDHPWFEVRADTLGREFTESAFKSHDGADIDPHTAVIESVVDTPGDATATFEDPGENIPDRAAGKSREEPEEREVGADLEVEGRDAREASAGLEQERKGIDIGRDEHIIPPIDR